jgi:hypothetical protein
MTRRGVPLRKQPVDHFVFELSLASFRDDGIDGSAVRAQLVGRFSRDGDDIGSCPRLVGFDLCRR